MWVKTHRGEMHDDPVVFAITDGLSLLSIAAFVAVMLVGRAALVMRAVSSWGRLSRACTRWSTLADRSRRRQSIAGSPAAGLALRQRPQLRRRLPQRRGVLWATRGLDRFLAFDAETGLIECEAGVTLKEVIDLVLPRGWFPAVTPGTQFVTVGGAIANDVHGKNHHRTGCFGDHVESLTLLRTDGSRIVCGPDGAGVVSRHGRRPGADRPHRRRRFAPAAGRRAVDRMRAPAFQSLERVLCALGALDRMGVHRVVDRLRPLRGGEPRGIFFAATMPPRRATRRRNGRGACRSRRRFPSSTGCRCAPSTRSTTGSTRRHRARGETLSALLLSARRAAGVEPHLWPARLLSVPVRRAQGESGRGCPRFAAGDRGIRTRLLSFCPEDIQ